MHASTVYEIERATPTLIYGFDITEKYMVAAAKKCIVHSLECQECKRNRGQVCANNQAVFEIGLIWDAKCHATSDLMLTASRVEPGKMGLWNLVDGTHIRDFLGNNSPAERVAFLQKDSTFASGSHDGEILLWDRAEEKPVRVLRGHSDGITKLVTYDEFLFSGSLDKTVRVWNTTTGECVRVLHGHSDYIWALTFSPDYSLLHTANGRNGEFRIWDWRNGKLVAEYLPMARQIPQYWDTDGNLVTCGMAGKVETWTQAGVLSHTFAAHEAPMRAFVRAGRFAISVGTHDGLVKVWDWENQKRLFNLQDPVTLIANITTARGKLAVGSWTESSELNRIQVWDLDKIQEAASRHISREE